MDLIPIALLNVSRAQAGRHRARMAGGIEREWQNPVPVGRAGAIMIPGGML